RHQLRRPDLVPDHREHRAAGQRGPAGDGVRAVRAHRGPRQAALSLRRPRPRGRARAPRRGRRPVPRTPSAGGGGGRVTAQGSEAYGRESLDALGGLAAGAELEAMPIRSTAFATLYGVRLTSVGPYRLFGYLSVPAGAGPFPAIYYAPKYQ